MSVGVNVDLGPLDGVRDVWERGTILGWMLDGFSSSIIDPVGVRS